MNTTENLKAIRAKCLELLEIAEKRTQGKWDAFQRNEEIGTNYYRIAFDCGTYGRDSDSLHGYCGEANAAFTAACAGPAEAGWRATIAAIDFVMSFGLQDDTLAKNIITAWEMIEIAKLGSNQPE